LREVIFTKKVTEIANNNPGTNHDDFALGEYDFDFGEYEISKFILEVMPQMTFDLNLFQGTSFEYAQRVTFNNRNMDVHIKADQGDCHLMLQVRYPYEVCDVSPLQQFSLYRDSQ